MTKMMNKNDKEFLNAVCEIGTFAQRLSTTTCIVAANCKDDLKINITDEELKTVKDALMLTKNARERVLANIEFVNQK